MKRNKNISGLKKKNLPTLLLQEIESRIRISFGEGVKKIFLYGSYAREDYNQDSDIDILVVVDDENIDNYRNLRYKIVDDLYDDFSVLSSILIEKQSVFNKFRTVSPFLININEEGVLLYG